MKERLKIIKKCALEAGEILKYYYSNELHTRFKGKIDMVTDADISSQEKIINIIRSEFPHDEIIAEENSKNTYNFKSTWIIDPLDGTTNFIHRLPWFAISIAYIKDNEIKIGLVYIPLLNEFFLAIKGEGAFLNDEKIFVSKEDNLEKCLVGTGFPYSIHENYEEIVRRFKNILINVRGIRRPGAAAQDLAYVACGRFDAFYEDGLKPWDVAAGILLVSEAGGKVTDYDGNEYIIGQSDQILASNFLLHDKIMKLLS
ncbi:myo-inositol-1(or 4)-monophosphatase [Thermodesulfobium acidiphilum]|uniref:Inositol-1-monophosphatase n=1 Tax=Thermodesulfobium acidiphilum TaxID=1794699 RepID=A0A2R4W0C7_THEAF|nr:inositol monophosphatase family protein [Thermodesulfobium acidiphilum]AWB10259.1 myo-inositol-1(or 4)-monophosphatase [Thermodesulfobium acidiphilum]PMP84615.1 MAG: inositol monophosphatase [Thermodesulfobium narugense]